MNYEYHELANLFPLMDESQYSDLVADIKENGLVESIVLHEGKILDGRNRYNACNDAGVEPNFVEYEGEDALSYVISLNLNRRHLNESQRAMIGARLANMKVGKKSLYRENSTDITNNDAAQKLNVSDYSIKKAKKVQKEDFPKQKPTNKLTRQEEYLEELEALSRFDMKAGGLLSDDRQVYGIGGLVTKLFKLNSVIRFSYSMSCILFLVDVLYFMLKKALGL